MTINPNAYVAYRRNHPDDMARKFSSGEEFMSATVRVQTVWAHEVCCSCGRKDRFVLHSLSREMPTEEQMSDATNGCWCRR